jgi:N-acetylgalactosamine kinase
LPWNSPNVFKSITEWIQSLNGIRAGDQAAFRSPLGRNIARIYGTRPQVLRQRMTLIRRALVAFGEKFGRENPVAVIRCPGRVNLMGRHVDHQGGHCNPVAIDREVVMIVQPRKDNAVFLANIHRLSFPFRSFVLSDLNRRLPQDEWKAFVDAKPTSDFIAANSGDWSLYVLAPILRLQNRFPERRLRGMNVMAAGDIPIAAGLSSSSALVVASAEATCLLNDLPLERDEFPVLIGESEWFVGTRGGFNDHAAMKLAQRGSVLKVKFFDFAVEEIVDFPPECCLAICDSGVKAKKGRETKNIYNAKVTAYALAKALIQTGNPQWAARIARFRDIQPVTLGIPLQDLYRAILRLPRSISRGAFRMVLGQPAGPEIEALFTSHTEPEAGYHVRGVALFGVAECERSRLFAEYLRKGDISGLGRLMNVSHDGDRVSFEAADGERMQSSPMETDERLLDLISRAESDDPLTREGAAIHLQPGAYGCSTPRVDQIVDAARATSGVYGAQLSGAGLGGCAMVLLDQAACPELKKNLLENCFSPTGIEGNVLICTPIAGSGPLLPA